jgi:hypothetical protein
MPSHILTKPGSPLSDPIVAHGLRRYRPGVPSHRLKPFIEPWRRNAEISEFTERGATIAKILVGIYVGLSLILSHTRSSPSWRNFSDVYLVGSIFVL